jgi:hypothetical protein
MRQADNRHGAWTARVRIIQLIRGFSMTMAGGGLASKRTAMPLEILIGRGLACCLRPQAAWRVLTRTGRAFIVCAYATGGFVATLAALYIF